MSIILGSSSPRRKEILDFFSLPFTVANPDFDEESITKDHDPAAFACLIAKQKALSISKTYKDDVILTADTVVHCKGTIFTKPLDEQSAYEMLSTLSGSWHSVFTGVCVMKNDQLFCLAEETKILFHPLSKKQIETYHDHFYFNDKAGGYAIQKGGSIIVKKIEGCYYNIMGLPLNTTRELLNKVGIDLWDFLKPL